MSYHPLTSILETLLTTKGIFLLTLARGAETMEIVHGKFSKIDRAEILEVMQTDLGSASSSCSPVV